MFAGIGAGDSWRSEGRVVSRRSAGGLLLSAGAGGGEAVGVGAGLDDVAAEGEAVDDANSVRIWAGASSARRWSDMTARWRRPGWLEDKDDKDPFDKPP